MASGVPDLSKLELADNILVIELLQDGSLFSSNQAFSQLLSKGDQSITFENSLGKEQFNYFLQILDHASQDGKTSIHVELKHEFVSPSTTSIKWQFFINHKKYKYKYLGICHIPLPVKEESISYQVIDHVNDCFFVLDKEGTFLEVNPGFAKLFSSSRDHICSLNVDDVFGNADARLCSKKLIRQLQKAEVSDFEIHFKAIDEWWHFVVCPASDQTSVYAKNVTESKHYELELKRSEASLNALLNSTSESNLLLDKHICILRYNKAAELLAKKVLGKDLQEGACFLDYVPEVRRDRFREKFYKALEGQTIQYERKITNPEDKNFWFKISFFPVFDKDNQVLGVSFNAENIRALKEAEEKRNMYALIAGHITDAVIITDANGLTTWVNESFVRKTGYSLEDLRELTPGSVLQGPDSDPASIKIMEEAVKMGRPFHVELINYTKAGKPFNVEIKSDPYYRSDGKLLGFISIQPDVTHRKKEENRRIRESLIRYQAIFENSNNAILLANDQGYYLDANPAACQISGYSLDELKKLNVSDLLDTDSQFTRTEDWSDFIKKGKLEGTVAIRAKQGEMKILDYRAVADILPGLHLSILSDVTQQHLAEQKLIEQNQHLNRINNEKNRLFSIIAHDLRSPLNSLSGMIQLVQENMIAQEDFEKYTAKINDRIQHSLNLMDNLFQWAQHQLKGIRLEKIHIDLHEIANNKLALFKDAAEKKEIAIENHIGKGTWAWADFNMIDLVVRNLVANAIKFCSEGGQIKLSTQRKEEALTVCVEDTGVGIAKENLASIFGGEVSTRGTHDEKGSGLGLQVCKEFIEKHGGVIWVESELNQGSSFYFSLPIK